MKAIIIKKKMKKSLLGTKLFSKEEQKKFSINSLACNPAHVFSIKKKSI